ncbi:MAG: cytochrome c oxidase subunit II [Chthoniobacterales bacterium]
MFRSFLRFTLVLATAFLLLATAAHAETHTTNLYWAPQNATVGGEKIDVILNSIFVLTTVVFILTQAFLIYYLVKYRRREGVKAQYSHGNNKLEVVWTLLPTIIFIALVIWSNRTWHELLQSPIPPDALEVQVVAYQFGWDFLYPGADGKLGASDVRLITPDNKFGQDKSDPAGKDDFTSAEFVIPVNKVVHILLRSRDVIHSFYVPQFRLYQDAIPGRTISWVRFQTIRTGNFELACSQLCGAGHYNMKAKIRVVSQEEYDKWFAGKAQAHAAAAAASATESKDQNLVQASEHK